MNKKSITFRNNSQEFLSEFINSLKAQTTEPTESWNSCILSKFESLLYQASNISPVKIVGAFKIIDVPLRQYSTLEMFEAQMLLDMLNFLDDIKHMSTIVNAKSALRHYLYSGFKLIKCLPKEKELDSFSLLPADQKLEFGNKHFVYYEETNQPSKSVTIRNHLNWYLETTTKNTSPDIFQLMLSKNSDNKNSISEEKKRYYIPVKHLPELLLGFTYYDGRDFSGVKLQKSTEHLPRLNIHRQNSKISYKLALSYAKELIPENSLQSSKSLCTNYCLDSIFCYCKLEMLNNYFNLYTSDLFLNQMIRYFSLSYCDIINLKDRLLQEIFNDRDFINEGLQSPYLDFMLPFDIQFQYDLFATHVIPHDQDLTKTIEKCKAVARDCWNLSPSLSDFSALLDFSSNGVLNLNSTEEKIVNELQKNTFFIKHYSLSNEILTKWSNSTYDHIQTVLFESVQKHINQHLYSRDLS